MTGEELRERRGLIPQLVLSAFSGVHHKRISRHELQGETLTVEEQAELQKWLTLLPSMPYREVLEKYETLKAGS